MCHGPKSRSLLAVLAACALVMSACSDEDGGVGGSDPEPDPVDTQDVEAGPPPPDTGSLPGPEFDFDMVAPIVQAFVDDHSLNGAGLIVVDRDQGVVHEEYWGELSADRISLIASSTKMITAGVLLHLDDQGLLDIDAPVADAVAWGSGNPEVTPAQLISNSSGLVGLANFGFAPYICQFSPTGTLQECGESIFTTADDDAEVIPPDTEFRYGGAQWQVAGAIAEAVSGKSWDELIDEIYIEPCGLETLAYNNPFLQLGTGALEYPAAFNGDPATLEPVDNPNMEGGVHTTTGDYAKLLLMHLQDGMCGDTRVLSRDALDRLHRDRVAAVYEGDAAVDNPGYGMGWWVDRESGRLSGSGAYGTVPWLDLDDGYGAYLVIEATSILGLELAERLFEPVEAAMGR